MKNSLLLFLLFFSLKTFSQTEKKFTIEGIERKAIFYEPKIKSEKLQLFLFFTDMEAQQNGQVTN